MDDLDLGRGIRVPATEISVETSRASGPGGQHVNKTASRVTLRFPIQESESLDDTTRERLMKKLSSRLTKCGELLVSSERHRDQRRNLEDAFERMQVLLRSALKRPKPRRPTRPTRAAVEKRLKGKRKRAERKSDRRPPAIDD